MILCAGLLFSSGLLAAQTPDKSWTLDDCIRYGLENNITVKQYELAKENQEITVETTRFSRLPDLSANVGQTFYFGRTPDRDGVYQDQTGSNSSLGINTSVNLFSGFRVTKPDQGGETGTSGCGGRPEPCKGGPLSVHNR